MSRSGGTLAAALLVALAAVPVAGGSADERLGLGTDRLQNELRTLKTRVDRAPRATAYDLDRARRRLSEQRLETPDDPRLLRLDQQIRDLQWRADRALRRPAGAGERAALEPVPDDQLRPSRAMELYGDRPPVGTGKRVILIQSGLRAADADLGRGRVEDAAAQVAMAATALAALRADLGAAAEDDPNLVAPQAEITALKQRIETAGSAG
jgi:hypothetical protein